MARGYEEIASRRRKFRAASRRRAKAGRMDAQRGVAERRKSVQSGFKVFDADAHVVEPKDLWERFLDARHRHRVGRRQPFPGTARFRPATVDGRYTQSLATLYGNQQEAVRWTTEAMIAKYGEVVSRGFDGAGVAESMRREGVDVMVLYGPGYDMWLDGIDPELQAAMARPYNRWAEEMRETSGGRVLPAA